jgi:beta-lactamase superfamily II metal-dependent hydrolase
VALETLEGIRTYHTDRQGSVEVMTDGQRYLVRAERGL